MALKDLIDNQSDIAKISSYLDKLSFEHRLKECNGLARKQYGVLYALAKSSTPLTLQYFVPDHLPDNTEIIHHGRNSLALPNAFRLFQKRFCRPAGERARLFGYNHGIVMKGIGPGYFVAKSTAGNPEWAKRSGVVIDYFEVPDKNVVDEWPKVIPNSKRLQYFVYHKTRDFMRRVSQHVSIGAAYKKEKPMGVHFILCRDDKQSK